MSVDEKPPHVRVAEALGCKPAPIHGHDEGFYCTCRDEKHRGPQDQYGDILRYDLDWAATGPLIERYRMEIMRKNMGTDDEFWRAYALDDGAVCGDGETVLLAVCDAILGLKLAGKLEAVA